MVDLNWLSTGKCTSRKNVVPIRRLCCGLATDDDENALDHGAALAHTVHLDFCALGDGHALALRAYSSDYRFKLPRSFALLRMIADERKSGGAESQENDFLLGLRILEFSIISAQVHSNTLLASLVHFFLLQKVP